jgi:hypothetical protein
MTEDKWRKMMQKYLRAIFAILRRHDEKLVEFEERLRRLEHE